VQLDLEELPERLCVEISNHLPLKQETGMKQSEGTLSCYRGINLNSKIKAEMADAGVTALWVSRNSTFFPPQREVIFQCTVLSFGVSSIQLKHYRVRVEQCYLISGFRINPLVDRAPSQKYHLGTRFLRCSKELS
jgi:hypothetical protein